MLNIPKDYDERRRWFLARPALLATYLTLFTALPFTVLLLVLSNFEVGVWTAVLAVFVALGWIAGYLHARRTAANESAQR